MGKRARQAIIDRLSPEERFDLGLLLADRTVEAYLRSLPEPASTTGRSPRHLTRCAS